MKIHNIDRERHPDKYLAVQKSDSFLFKEIENIFDDWIENSNPANEYEEMYFSDENIYSKKAAIIGAIEQIFDTMDEYNLPFIYLSDKRLDIVSVFE